MVRAHSRACRLSVMPGSAGQLDGGCELATLLEYGADRSGLSLADDEHSWSMGTRVAAGNMLRQVER